mmetsp:Transcript_19041/g.40025  ORF Transcript_19041/g.40025 Transcript_19041/m.40025 type:complete len:206 (-) Transcript_19041:115-732(-)
MPLVITNLPSCPLHRQNRMSKPSIRKRTQNEHTSWRKIHPRHIMGVFSISQFHHPRTPQRHRNNHPVSVQIQIFIRVVIYPIVSVAVEVGNAVVHVLVVEGSKRLFDGAFDGEGGGGPLVGRPFGSGVVSGVAVDGDDDIGSLIFGVGTLSFGTCVTEFVAFVCVGVMEDIDDGKVGLEVLESREQFVFGSHHSCEFFRTNQYCS